LGGWRFTCQSSRGWAKRMRLWRIYKKDRSSQCSSRFLAGPPPWTSIRGSRILRGAPSIWSFNYTKSKRTRRNGTSQLSTISSDKSRCFGCTSLQCKCAASPRPQTSTSKSKTRGCSLN
jgi:hypothetical protein